MKLETLAQSIPAVSRGAAACSARQKSVQLMPFSDTLSCQRPGSGDSSQEALQDVDDWDLTELNPDWDLGDSSEDVPPLPPLVHI